MVDDIAVEGGGLPYPECLWVCPNCKLVHHLRKKSNPDRIKCASCNELPKTTYDPLIKDKDKIGQIEEAFAVRAANRMKE